MVSHVRWIVTHAYIVTSTGWLAMEIVTEHADTPKNLMAWAALILHSCTSIPQTGLRYSLPPRDIGVSFWEWCSHFQSVVFTKMSFKNVLPEPLLPLQRKGPFLSPVSHFITTMLSYELTDYNRLLSKIREGNAYISITVFASYHLHPLTLLG